MVSNRHARMALNISFWESNTRFVTYYTGTRIRFRPVQLKKSRRRNRADKRFIHCVQAFFEPLKTGESE